jgi:hypothetical protein
MADQPQKSSSIGATHQRANERFSQCTNSDSSSSCQSLPVMVHASQIVSLPFQGLELSEEILSYYLPGQRSGGTLVSIPSLLVQDPGFFVLS